MLEHVRIDIGGFFSGIKFIRTNAKSFEMKWNNENKTR